MASEDEIRPMLENEESSDIKEDVDHVAINNGAPKTPSNIEASDDDDDPEVDIVLTGCSGSALCDPSNFTQYFLII